MKYFFLLPALVCLGGSLAAQPAIAPTQTDSLTLDLPPANLANPNDEIRYHVIAPNTGTAPATGLQLNVTPDPNTTFVPGSFQTSPLALNDAYACTGNVGITVAAASGLKANDFDDDLAGATVGAGTFATAQNGSIALAADGSFTYTPPAGFTGTDTYAYTLHDGNGVGGWVPNSDAATVTFTVSNLIYFVDNGSMAAASDGRLTSPFKTLADFNAGSPASGLVVYIEHTGTTYTGGIVLSDGETVIGEGHTGAANLAAVLPFSLAPNSNPLPNLNGSRPVIANAGGDGVTLAQHNVLRGFNVGDCSDFGMENAGTATVGALTVSEVAIDNKIGGGFRAGNGSGVLNAAFDALSSGGGSNGIALNACAGAFSAAGGTLASSSGPVVRIVGGTVAFTYGGSLNGNAAAVVEIDDHDSGAIVFQTGNIASTGGGILVQNCNGGSITFANPVKSLTTGANSGVRLLDNGGSAIDFTGGGLAIATTTATGFDASGGGTLSVTGAGNTITSLSNAALNVQNTSIASANLNFLRISAGNDTDAADPSYGLVLQSTGTAGGLVVTGSGGDGTGGLIQNILLRGASITSSARLSLKDMQFAGASQTDALPCDATDNSGCNAAVYLNSVSGATLDNVDITGLTAQQGINLREVSGFKLLNSTIANAGAGGQAEEGGVYAVNLFGTGAADRAEIANTTISFPGGRGLTLNNRNQQLELFVSGSSFNDTQSSASGTDGLEANAYGWSVPDNQLDLYLDIRNSSFLRNSVNGVQTRCHGSARCRVDITASTLDYGGSPAGGGALEILAANHGRVMFNVNGNPTVRSAGTTAINAFSVDTARMEGRINGNTVAVAAGSGSGIRVAAQDSSSAVVEIDGNTVTGVEFDNGIENVARNGKGRLDATVSDNNISVGASANTFIRSAAGSSGSAHTNKTCVWVKNNVLTGGPAFQHHEGRVVNAHELILQGGGTSMEESWNNNANSPASPPAVMNPFISGAGVISFAGACATPAHALPF